MPRILFAAFSGLLFGLGLVISAMIDPAKVLGFLDLAGPWDASLALVMAAAVAVAALGFMAASRRPSPLADSRFHGPTATAIDRPLVIGAALFGLGWGLIGYCPGPALTSLPLGHPETWLFVAAMLLGMLAHRGYQRLARGAAPGGPAEQPEPAHSLRSQPR